MSQNERVMFRYLQILTTMLNEFQNGLLILSFIVIPILVFSYSLVSFIKVSHMELVFIASLLGILGNGFLAVLCIQGQMAAVYMKSEELIENMKRKQNFFETKKERMIQHKFYKSCMPLRIMMGSANYIDNLTPLNCLNHAMDLSVNILLLSR